MLDNRDQEITISKNSKRIEIIGRYQCSACKNYCIIAFNSVEEANHNYCPQCGCRIKIRRN